MIQYARFVADKFESFLIIAVYYSSFVTIVFTLWNLSSCVYGYSIISATKIVLLYFLIFSFVIGTYFSVHFFDMTKFKHKLL